MAAIRNVYLCRIILILKLLDKYIFWIYTLKVKIIETQNNKTGKHQSRRNRLKCISRG